MSRSPELDRAMAHQPRLVRSHEVQQQVHGASAAGRVNTWIAVHVTKGVGSMWAAYLFAGLALISMPAAFASHDVIIIVAWIAQTFLQLVLLPIIIVGQNVQAAASDKRAEETYKDAEAVLHEAMQIQEHLAAQDAALERILQHLGIPMPPPVTGTAVPETGL